MLESDTVFHPVQNLVLFQFQSTPRDMSDFQPCHPEEKPLVQSAFPSPLSSLSRTWVIGREQGCGLHGAEVQRVAGTPASRTAPLLAFLVPLSPSSPDTPDPSAGILWKCLESLQERGGPTAPGCCPTLLGPSQNSTWDNHQLLSGVSDMSPLPNLAEPQAGDGACWVPS